MGVDIECECDCEGQVETEDNVSEFEELVLLLRFSGKAQREID